MLPGVRLVVLGLACVLAAGQASARAVHLATTAQIEKSGVLKPLLARFKQAGGPEVQVVAGTAAQVLDLARRREVDLVLIDDNRPEVEKLTAQGVAGRRIPLMFNELLLVGPKSGSAGAHGKDIVAAFKKLDAARALFISRGDQSITHVAEQRLWLRAGMKSPKGGGHRECGCGMGGALDIAATAFGYTLADKASWAAFRNRGDLVALVEGDPQLILGYSIVPIMPSKPARSRSEAQKADDAQRARDVLKFTQWLTSAPAQAAIASHRMGGNPFFYPKVGK